MTDRSFHFLPVRVGHEKVALDEGIDEHYARARAEQPGAWCPPPRSIQMVRAITHDWQRHELCRVQEARRSSGSVLGLRLRAERSRSDRSERAL